MQISEISTRITENFVKSLASGHREPDIIPPGDSVRGDSVRGLCHGFGTPRRGQPVKKNSHLSCFRSDGTQKFCSNENSF